MIEVAFSQSACGSLRMAQRYGIGNYTGSSVVFVANGQTPSKEELEAAQREADARARREWENAVPLGGNPGDVFCIDVAWSIGDIADSDIGDGRRAVLEQASCIWPTDADTHSNIEKSIRSAQSALHTILDRAAQGESVRIWYSHNPDEMCGFYWLLSKMKAAATPGSIYAVKLPEWEYSGENTLCTYVGWGKMEPGAWGRYVSLQQEVKPPLLTACSMRWAQLQKENAPLRIYLNGRLQSAPETTYDSFILRELSAQPDEFVEAHVIGTILGKYQLGIGDAWIALRIEQFIREGMFEVLTTPEPDRPIYSRRLRKSKGKQSV